MLKDVIFPGQTGFYQGKVRDLYYVGGVIVAHTTNRISAFDVILPFEIPSKGAILNLIASYFMKATEDIIPNCLIDVPTQNTAIWRKVEPFTFEVIIRAYNTGSFHRNYVQNAKVNPWGYELSPQLKKNEKLRDILITPTSKAVSGHDEDISEHHILSHGLANPDEWAYIKEKAFELFKRGVKMGDEIGLILVDTKYEFGKDQNGKIYLIDEVHTPDSSRYWYKEGYVEAFAKGEEPKALSKEFVRDSLIQSGFTGEKGQSVPEFSPQQIQDITNRYIELYEVIFNNKNTSVASPKFLIESEDWYSKVLNSLVKVRPMIEGPKVSIVMGSKSDLNIMKQAIDVLVEAGVPFEASVVSAHRIPMKLAMYGTNLINKGIKVIIAGAGGAAHLPGMIAAYTVLPVIGVPVKSTNSMIGLDSLLSINQMPPGVPVATMAIDGAQNAGLLALQILATSNENLKNYLLAFKKKLISKVDEMKEDMSENYFFSEI